MASRTRVVLNLAGPYTTYGSPVIEACVAGAAHYVDLTGEIPFVRRIIDDFDARATDAGVKLVQVCGFEALPPDLSVLLAAEAARERWSEDLVDADLQVSISGPPGLPRPSDMVSGGTAQSMVAAASGEDPSSITDPAALIADAGTASEIRRRSPISLMPRRNSRGAVITSMAPSAFINPAVIHRTAALLAVESGRGQPRYREGSPWRPAARFRSGYGRWRACGRAGRPRTCSPCTAVGAPPGGRGARSHLPVIRLRPGGRAPRSVEVAHVPRGPHHRGTRGRGRGRGRGAPGVPGDGEDAGRGWPSAADPGVTPERAGA
jgi:hypothetical protein